MLGDMKRAEFDRLASLWDKSTFDTLAHSLRYHASKHGAGDLASYLRRAANFSKKGARKYNMGDGAIKYLKGNGEFLIERAGSIVTYGKNR